MRQQPSGSYAKIKGNTLVSVTQAKICIVTQQLVSVDSHHICMVELLLLHRGSPFTWPVKLYQVVRAQVQAWADGVAPLTPVVWDY